MLSCKRREVADVVLSCRGGRFGRVAAGMVSVATDAKFRRYLGL